MSQDQQEQKPRTVLDTLVDTISGIFIPFFGIFTAAGLLRALIAVAVSLGWLDQASSTYVILNGIGDGVFQFLPIFIGFSAGKKFGCNEWVTMAIAAFLCVPAMVGLNEASADVGGPVLFGLPVTLPDSGYLQSVFPIIFAAYLQSWIEKPVAKLPGIVRDLFGNMIVLVVTSLITLLVVGPVVNAVSSGIANGIMAILKVSPVLAGFVLAAIWPVLILFGMHWGIIPIMFSNLSTLGYDVIGPIVDSTNFVIGAAVLGIFLKTKRTDIKKLATECMASDILGGISEPAIYGLLLKYKRPFVIMCLCCGISGAITGALDVHQSVIFTTSIFTLPVVGAYLGIPHLLGILAACVAAAVLTFLFGFNDDMVEEEAAQAQDAAASEQA